MNKIIAALGILLLASGPGHALTVQEVTSHGGVKAYLSEDHTIPVIALSFMFDGGSAMDAAGKEGLSTFAVSLLDEGAGDLDSFAFQSELEDLAIRLGFGADKDAIRGSLTTTTPNAARAYQLLKMAMTVPRFDQEPVERIRRQILVRLAQDTENPGRIASKRLMEVLFPGHPYGKPDDGTPETVTALTADDLRGWLKQRFARDRLIVAASGDISKDELTKLLDDIFGALPATTGLKVDIAKAAVPAKGSVERVEKNLPQTVVYIGQPGIDRNDPDWYTAQIVDYVLGGGVFESRLMQEVREKRGLAYGVSTSLSPLDHAAIITAGVGTRSDAADESLKVIREEWAKMHEAGPTEDEVDGAKKYLTGAWPLRFTSTGRIADILVAVQKDNLGLDYLDKRNSFIEKVTVAEAQRVAKRLYLPDALSVVIVGPPPKPAGPPAGAGGPAR